MDLGSDRRVYVGSTSGEGLRWDPQSKSWGALGKPLFAVPGRGVNHVRALCEGPGCWLYAGSCTGERARIHLDTAEVQKLPEPAEKGNWYVSAVARCGQRSAVVEVDPQLRLRKRDRFLPAARHGHRCELRRPAGLPVRSH